MGMCFGVRDALQIAHAIQKPAQFTVFGQLVHNPVVTQSLQSRGFTALPEQSRSARIDSPGVLITAHGISDTQRRAFESQGKRIVDTTCPLVRRAHAAALTLASESRHVLVIGKPGHVEVLGLTGDLPSFDILESLDAVRAYPHSRLGIIAQTTTTDTDFDVLSARIRHLNPTADIRAIRTVCQPTRDRQDAVRDLVAQVDALIVVGGPASNNSRMLAQVGVDAGKPSLLIAGAQDLTPHTILNLLPPNIPCPTLGLTAGTSTLDATIDQVEAFLRTTATHELAGHAHAHG